jgi:iron(III) transport system permease protein
MWLALGWLGFAILPWYFGDGLLFGPAASGLLLSLKGERPWLLPLILPLLLPLVPVVRPSRNRAATATWLIASGLAGLLWLGLEGFAIDHRGWSAEWIADLFGTMGPRQGGMGCGAFLALLAFLMLVCRPRRARVYGGDAFTVSALGLIIGARRCSCSWIPSKRRAPEVCGAGLGDEFPCAVLDRSVWGLEMHDRIELRGLNNLFLALVVAFSSTASASRCTLVVTRTAFPPRCCGY